MFHLQCYCEEATDMKLKLYETNLNYYFMLTFKYKMNLLVVTIINSQQTQRTQVTLYTQFMNFIWIC